MKYFSTVNRAVNAIGSVLKGKYRLDKVLGNGGMGVVYLATAIGGRRVAVKELSLDRLDPLDRKSAVELFKNEAELLSSLDHPGLVKVQDHFGCEQGHYLVMDYIDGITLGQGIKRKKGFFSLEQFNQIASQLCDVLHYLHDRIPAVIFRDLKPSNVMITRQMEVRLIDFGIARHFTDETRTQTFIKGLGSAGYSPLEQYGAGTTDPRSDIYSLGATLYSFLTKLTPPPVFNIVAGVDHLKPIRSVNPEVPAYLEAVIGRMMALRKEQRFDSIAQLRPNLLNPPEDEEDPTGTLGLAKRRAASAELGPCLVCKRIGPEPGPFFPPHCPLSQSRVDLTLPLTLILGLKTEKDPQSGLHFQKGDQKKHTPHFDLGFRGAAALVLTDGPVQGIQGDKLSELIKKELQSMARHLLNEFQQLTPSYQLASVPVLEDLAKQDIDCRLPAYQAIYDTYASGMSQESALLQSQGLRLADELYLRGYKDRAIPLYQSAFDWLALEIKRELRAKGFDEAEELLPKALRCLSRLPEAQKASQRFLSDIATLYQKLGRDPERPYQAQLERAKADNRPLAEAEAYWQQANLYLASQEWEKAEAAATQALNLAEVELGEDSADLYQYVQTLANCQEHLLRPERLETKSRALILKYKAKAR